MAAQANKCMAKLPPPNPLTPYHPEDFAWGSVYIKKKVIIRKDQSSGYKCPICNFEQKTTRKETFRKHLKTHGKKGKLDIPSMKEKCQHCPRFLEANKHKRKLHLLRNCRGHKGDVHAGATTDKEMLDCEEDINEEEEYDDTFENDVDETSMSLRQPPDNKSRGSKLATLPRELDLQNVPAAATDIDENNDSMEETVDETVADEKVAEEAAEIVKRLKEDGRLRDVTNSMNVSHLNASLDENVAIVQLLQSADEEIEQLRNENAKIASSWLKAKEEVLEMTQKRERERRKYRSKRQDISAQYRRKVAETMEESTQNAVKTQKVRVYEACLLSLDCKF